jgi:hypothetical protein
MRVLEKKSWWYKEIFCNGKIGIYLEEKTNNLKRSYNFYSDI